VGARRGVAMGLSSWRGAEGAHRGGRGRGRGSAHPRCRGPSAMYRVLLGFIFRAGGGETSGQSAYGSATSD